MAALAAVGAIVGAIGKLKSGEDAAQQGELQAIQLRANANASQASAQRQAVDVQRRTDLVSSRVTALAAASGGSATDPSVVTDIENIQGEGHYQAMSRLYNGEVQGQSLDNQADTTIREGNAKRTASYYSAASSVLSTGSNLYTKYGAGATNG